MNVQKRSEYYVEKVKQHRMERNFSGKKDEDAMKFKTVDKNPNQTKSNEVPLHLHSTRTFNYAFKDNNEKN